MMLAGDSVQLSRALRGTLIAVALGVLVFSGLLLYGDAGRVSVQLERLGAWTLAPVALLTLFNYTLRWVKWHFLLHRIGVRGLGYARSGLLFCAGMSMVLSPGKVGELLKSYFLRQLTGTPVTRSAPIIFVERLSDGFAMLLLAAAGFARHAHSGLGLVPVAAALGAVLFLVSWGRPVQAVLIALERSARLRPAARRGLTLYESAQSLIRWPTLLPCIGLGVVSWSGEALALCLILDRLGQPANVDLAVDAAFTLAASVLVGSASMLPGGLGASELSIAGLLQATRSLSPDQAVAATLLIRAGTLWLGVLIGLVSLPLLLLIVQRRQHRNGISRDCQEQVAAAGDGDL